MTSSPDRLCAEVLRLHDVMARLRDPNGGCPWDLEQTFETIAPYTIEEAYEVEDAILRGDMADLRAELGDLLLQTVYHSRMAEEAGAFDLADVAAAIADKMIARHPHVFTDAAETVPDAAAQKENWEHMKARERGRSGALAGVANNLPALMRAEKLQKRAARVGFDWPDASGPRRKIDEELAEMEAAATGEERLHEGGDLLFSAVNYLRHAGIDPEVALRAANRRFEARFTYVEEQTERPLEKCSADELDALWKQAKSSGL